MSKTWKGAETKAAKFWGASGRTPLSGMNSKHTGSDTLHPRVFIEVKDGMQALELYRSRDRAVEIFVDAEATAERENKRAVLVLHPKGLPHIENWPTYLRVTLRASIDRPFEDVVVCVPQGVARRLLGEEPLPVEPGPPPPL